MLTSALLLAGGLTSTAVVWAGAVPPPPPPPPPPPQQPPAAGVEDCKCLPGDACWPSAADWSAFNQTVGGKLVATVPLGAPCHGDAYDAERCKYLQDQWLDSTIHMDSSSSVMAPLFANASCDPFTARDRPCELGNYVAYAVAVSEPAHAAAAMRFAADRNLRLVIRNTGHDYHGRSTGAGALAIWTHHLKSTEVLDWDEEEEDEGDDEYDTAAYAYRGKALRIGAGVQGYEALAAAKEEGLVVVTGECPSVGLAGGYTQGGGHSALSTAHGLSADNTLAFVVATPRGELLTATRRRHRDLYWALSGAGSGSFGVVLSVTLRAHPDTRVAGAKFAVTGTANETSTTSNNSTTPNIYDIIDAFHAELPAIVDSGVMIIYYFSSTFLQVPAMTAPGKTAAEARAILQPLADRLHQLGATDFRPNVTEFASYHDHYDHYWGPAPAGNIQVGTTLFGGRLVPRSALPGFGPASRRLAELGATFIGVGTDVSRFGGSGSGMARRNAVLPQWRDAIVQGSITLPWSFQSPFADMVAEQDRITRQIQPVVEAATPGSGAYVNEADFQQPDWQRTFYGDNYPSLLDIKRRHDPEALLYVKVGVGSEAWDVAPDGRMCRAAAPGTAPQGGYKDL